MKYFITFCVCVAISVIGVFLFLRAVIHPGEGSFGIAKAVPAILLGGPPILFAIIWFPANLSVYLWQRRTQRLRHGQDDEKGIVIFSGCVFAILLCTYVTLFFRGLYYEHKYGPPRALQQAELKDVKGLIDGFCMRERRGEKLGPADGIYATMQQLVDGAGRPEVITYTADNLDDNSDFLQVIARSPNCPTNLIARFLLIPSTQLALAKNSALAPEILESLSHSTNSLVRSRVASNPNTAPAILRQLVTDSDSAVRAAAERSLTRENKSHE